MFERSLLAALHLLALGLGLGAIWMRARSLMKVRSSADLAPVFRADSLWGLAALLWIGTGMWRAFGGVEKGTSYYLQSNMFWVKMALLGVVLLLELWPVAVLIRWRLRASHGEAGNLRAAFALGVISYVQALLVVLMVFAATAMARGVTW